MSGVALGTAEAAVDEFRQMLLDRTLAFSGGQKQIDQPLAQMRLGEAVSQLRALQTQWHAMVKLVIDTCEPRGELTQTQRVGIRATATQVVHGVRRLLDDTILPNCGGGMYFETAPLQRRQRDIEVLKGHAMYDADRVFQMAGRDALGLPLAPTDLF
jgi:alkylation response protein AidB-like acyl-CoA dehydrogenase